MLENVVLLHIFGGTCDFYLFYVFIFLFFADQKIYNYIQKFGVCIFFI